MTEYRLDDLARVSGVTARNIRAYRERGLLDPPRRVGRSAYYDDYHLSQLKAINQLLRRGFNSAHIAEFFTSMREGADLTEILGIQQAILGPQPDDGGDAQVGSPEVPCVDIDPECDEARKVVDHGLGDFVEGRLVLKDATMAAIVERTPDPLLYVRAIVRISESTQESIEAVAESFVRALDEVCSVRFGTAPGPGAEEMTELSREVLDYRDLGTRVIANCLEDAVREQVVNAAAESTAFTTGILMSGGWNLTAPRRD